MKNRIQNTAVKLCSEFENDPIVATKILFEEYFDEYSVSLDFVADILGVEAIKENFGDKFAYDTYWVWRMKNMQRVHGY